MDVGKPCETYKYCLEKGNNSWTYLVDSITEGSILIENKAAGLHRNYNGYAYLVAPTTSSPKHEYVICVKQSYFKMDFICFSSSNADVMFVRVESGSVTMVDVLFRGAHTLAPFIHQMGGSVIIRNTGYNKILTHAMEVKSSLIKQVGGSLEILGKDTGSSRLQINTTVQKNNAGTSPLILDARTGENSQIASIAFRHFYVDTSSSYTPTSGLKEGGLITIIGQPSKPIEVIFEDCLFNVQLTTVTLQSSSKTYGGVLYGSFLKYVYINKCEFKFSDSVTSNYPSIGGALYIENVTTALTGLFI
jgi:hypothetical protein